MPIDAEEPAPTVALVVAATPLWRAGCLDAAPGCRVAERELEHTDADAWRLAWHLSARPENEDVLIFATPDPTVARWSLPDGAAFGDVVVGPPSLRAVEATLRAGHPAASIRLYVAAHGTADGVHLEDGVWSPAELRERLSAASGGAVVELVALDACEGGRMRQRGGKEDDLLVGRAAGGAVELVAQSFVPELDAVSGGAFTLVVASGLAGAADADGDGLLRAGEVARYLYAYTGTFAGGFAPVVRAPRQAAAAPVPRFSGAGTLTLWAGGEGEVVRWLVTVAQPEGEVLLADVLADGDHPVLLALPPASYGVWRASYERQGSGGLTLTTAGQHCLVEVMPGTSTEASGCESGATWPLVATRGEGAGSAGGALASHVRQTPPSRAGASAVHAASGPVLSMGPTAGYGWLGRELLRGGAETALAWGPADGRIHWRTFVSAEHVPLPGTASAWLLEGGVGPEWTLYAAPTWYVGVGAVGVGGFALALAGDGPNAERQAGLAFGAEVGPSFTHTFGAGTFAVGAAWSPRFSLVQDDVRQRLVAQPDPRSFELAMRFGWRL